MECGPIASGLSFNGIDKETGKPKFDLTLLLRLMTVYILVKLNVRLIVLL